MDDKNLTGELRTDIGTGGARRLRNQGLIPSVIYGKKDPVHISINAHEFDTKIKHIGESGLLNVTVGKKKYSVLIKDFQENYLKGEVTHLDFFEVTKGEKLHMSVPITLVNADTAAGVKLGGMIEQVLHEIDIECLPKNIPEHINCDVAEIGLNESFHVAELVIPEGVKVLIDPDRTVVTITSIKEEAEPAEEDEASEVEVIGATVASGEGE